MNTLTKKPDENPNNLLRSLLYSKPFESEESKYGKSMEPHAIQNLLAKTKNSTKFSMCQKMTWFLWKKINLYGHRQIQILTAPVVEVGFWRLSIQLNKT